MTYRPIITMVVLWCLAAGSPAQATTALVAWDPNLETDMAGYKVYYGSSGAYTQTIDVGTVTAQTISGLQEGLTYYFAVTAYDASGNESGYSQEMSKTIPDTTAPILSAVSAVDVGTSGAAITWNTNEAATSQVELGLTSSYGVLTTLDSSLKTSHRVGVSGLSSSTLYHYRVRSRDTAGNEVVGTDQTFTTVLGVITVPPSPAAWWAFNAPDGVQQGPTTALQALWHLNELGGTTAADASGRGHTATVNGAVFTSAGRFQRALAFDGVSQSAAVPNGPVLGNLGAQMTLEAWVKPGILDGAMRKLVDLRNASASCDSYVWQFGNFAFATPSKSSTMRASGGCGGSSTNTLEGNRFAVYTQFPFVYGTWYHVAVVYNGTLGTAAERAQIYVNGIDVTYVPYSTGGGGALYVTTDNPLRIGRNGVLAAHYFNGSLDELGIYNAPLTSAQVMDHYRRGFAEESMAGVFAAVDLNDGSAVGPVSATGHLAEALVFDGVDDRVTVPHHASIDPLNGWTLSAWIKRSATGVQHGVVEKFDWVWGLGGYAVRIGADNRLRGYVINGVAYNACIGTTSLAAQTWYHVAVTFDPGSDTLRCYVNGVAEAVNAAATLTPIPSRTSLKIGARGNDGGTPFAGSMDEVKIFARGLSPAEVAAEAAR